MSAEPDSALGTARPVGDLALEIAGTGSADTHGELGQLRRHLEDL